MSSQKQQAAFLAGAVALGLGLRHQWRQRRACSFTDRTVLISGGSRGLGLLMAELFACEGAHVTIAARDRDELERAQALLRDGALDVAIAVVDVSRPEEAERMVHDVVARRGRLDVLVNNAGVIKVGPLEHMEIEDFEEAMAVHFWGPLHTMQAAIPHMKRQGGGRIANISSVGGKLGVPHLVPYCAGKFALAGVSSALGSELARDNIAVTTVCPGLMRTGSPFNASFKGQHREEFAWFAIADSLPFLTTSGQRAAAQIVDAIRHGDAELVITWAAKLGVLAAALMPNTVALALQAANALLPAPASSSGDERRSGWQSMSDWAPSAWTRLAERAAFENNEA